MTTFIIIASLVLGAIFIYFWIKAVNFIFGGLENRLKEKKQKPKVENPYIAAQKAKDLNDKHYEEYLEYMEKSGSGVPFDKVKMEEEVRADSILSKFF